MIFPVVVVAGTALFLRRSKLGTAMRALADDRDNTSARWNRCGPP
jgi:branched-subunit amino acid ABC-type transport system permease component